MLKKGWVRRRAVLQAHPSGSHRSMSRDGVFEFGLAEMAAP